MDCKQIEGIIYTDYIDGKLDPQALKEVEGHIALCGRCRSLASGLTAIGKEFRQVKREEPRPAVWDKIRAEISSAPAEIFSIRDFFDSARIFLGRIRPAVVAVTAAALILVFLAIARLVPNTGLLDQQTLNDEMMAMVSLEENGNGAAYDLGTPAENYFL